MPQSDLHEQSRTVGHDPITETAAAAQGVFRYSTNLFTCSIEMATYGPPATPFSEIDHWLRDLDQRFSRFRAESELSSLNSAESAWVEISPSLQSLLQFSLTVAVASRGLVNVGILGPLMRAGYVGSWPFASNDPVPTNPGPPSCMPPLTSILELQSKRARLMPGFRVDLGGIAKGLWADEIVGKLGDNSTCGLGGDVACRGDGPFGEGWPVETPSGDIFLIKNGGVATSGIGKRRWGAKAHHLIDPRTSEPSCSDIAQATIVADTAGAADWIASAVVIGGTSALNFFDRRADMVQSQIESVGKPHAIRR